MTTLPQTTPSRMPRPNPNAITMPGTPGGMPPMMQPPAPVITPADLWRIFRANLWITIPIMVLSVIGGYFANRYLDTYHKKYTSTGLIQVQPAVLNNPLTSTAQNIDLNTIAYEQKGQIQLLRHESLLSQVFQNPEAQIKKTKWFAQYDGQVQRAKSDLADELRISPIVESKLIAVSMSYSEPKDTSDIVRDVIDQHLRNQQRVSQDDTSKRRAVLNSLKSQYDRRLNELSRELREKQIQLNIEGMGAPGRLSVKEMNMSARVQQLLELNMEGQLLQAKLGTMKQQNDRGEVPASIQLEIDRDPVLQDLERSLNMAEMQPVDPATANNPRTIAQQASITALRDKLELLRSQKLNKSMVAAFEQLQSELSANQQSAKTLSDEIDKMKQELGVLNNSLSVYLNAQDEEKFLRDQKKEVDDTLELMSVTANPQDTAKVTWAQPPETPDLPSFPKLKLTLAAAVAIGLLLSAGIAFLREVSDTTVRSPRDIHRIGQLNFLGMIPHEDDDPQAAGSRLPLVIFDAPTSMMADQLRQVRTRLQYAASLDTTRSLLITSPGPNDGKTVVACNLAAGLALNGRRILIVDADFRRPSLHKIFEVDNARGFTDVLQDINAFDECVRPTAVPNLSVLTSGGKPGNATEMLESQLLVDFIERTLEEYDHVIFDSGSIMVVSEAIALAPRVDGVVTVARARSNSRGLLLRMRDTLRQLKAEHLGVILNAVRAQGGGYYGRNIKTYYAYQDER
ncbi:MAG TPA: polysaccharide biosynthesis tyrosine autokinase [Tepidisphaeraceae bacterium]|jgi:capsular exopolysaccharide synthesis family protein|nr:polysaccharide biosynthesis tyrosine autokinase [Tepidisphaeraceae bacterium]